MRRCHQSALEQRTRTRTTLRQTHEPVRDMRLREVYHGPLKSARLRRKSDATSSTFRPCTSTAALRAAICTIGFTEIDLHPVQGALSGGLPRGYFRPTPP